MAVRYTVGIDLGTSNTALAFADLEAVDPAGSLRVFAVPQLAAAGEIARRPLLPSHLYLPGEHELPRAGRLPWEEAAVAGVFARELGSRVPSRHVFSAKSWLCHPSVDRTARILPWGAPAGVPRVSPVEASAALLAHLRNAWDAEHPEAPLAAQDLVVTVPASFDEGARALTLRAAAAAGLPRLVLLEEPQAAFYDWTRRHQDDLGAALGGARLVLVVDVGGGTTDLTLIEAELSAQSGSARNAPPQLRRVAVGDHLLLGGDNMDLLLARKAEAQLAAERGVKLTPGQFGALTQACRAAKELLLAPDAPERASVVVPGEGSRLVGGALATELSRDEARSLLLEGFFPRVARNEPRARAPRAAGLAELGLPYASDPAITRHVAAFLARHERTVHGASVDAVLYNGGALAADLLADRLTAALELLREGAARPLVRLSNDAPDLAVARGAATYGLVRRGRGLRIGGGSPRTYYVGVGAAATGAAGEDALCIVPRGAAEGEELEVPGRAFALALGTPVRFRLFAASGFRPEQPGDLLALSGGDAGAELAELPPLQTVVEGSGTAQVALRAQLTEIGTLELWCVARDSRRWKLEFQLRAGAAGDGSAAPVGALPRAIEPAREILQLVFGKKPQPVQGREVKDLWRNLEKPLGDRAAWPLSVNRDLWTVLWAGAQKRRRSPDHERVFLSLCGFTLRPGFGAPLDDWRVEQAWTLFAQGVTFHKDAAVWAAWWILWRRVAAGLPEAAHAALYEAVEPHLRPAPRGRVANPGKKPPGLAPDEMVRLLGALERLSAATKEEAGGWLFQRLEAGSAPGVLWALGRMGARVPVAGAAHHALAPEIAAAWLERLLSLDWSKHPEAAFAAAQLARLSGDRTRDLDLPLRERTAARLEAVDAPPEWSHAVLHVRPLDDRDAQRVFGEALPAGLRLA